MRAAVCRSFGAPFTIEDIAIDPPGPGQIEVRVAACAVCHSDISAADGDWGGDLPVVYGHEAAGHVTATGPGVTGFAPGDAVLVTLIRACGTCPACAGGVPTSCDHAWEIPPSPLRETGGGRIVQGLRTAAFAETAVVDRSQCVKLPADMAPEEACLLACGVITGVGAVLNTAAMRPGATVAVIGAGGVGLNAIQGASLGGAARIIAVDLSAEKAEAAREFGATDAIAADADAAAAVREITDGRGVDHVFVTVGAPQAFAAAPAMLAVGGSLVLVGMPPSGAEVPYKPTALVGKNQAILGSRMGKTVLARDIPWLIAQWRLGRLKLKPLISGRYGLDDINEAVAATRTGRVRRNVIVFG